MSRIGAYKPEDKQKNFLLPPFKKSHTFHEEKEKNFETIVYKKLKKVAELLESLYYNLSDDFGKNIKASVGQNLKLLITDLEIMHNSLKKTPFPFNKNLHCIHEMEGACSSLQKLSPNAIEVKQLSKIKHALHELDTLLAEQPKAEKKEPTKKKTPVKRVSKREA